MSFLYPFAFLLLLLPFLVYRFFPKQQTSGALLIPFFSALTENNPQRALKKRLSWRFYLLSLIFALLVTAVAQPIKPLPPERLPQTGRDIMMAIDLSESMRARDLSNRQLNRLDVVKAAADTFIKRREGDRLGLVFFSDRAYLQSPLSFDHEAVSALLSEAVIGLTGSNTAIGDAIAIALKRLRDSQTDNVNDTNLQPQTAATDNTDKNDNESRVLILLTDGSNTAGITSPLEAAKIAKALGIRIYTIGVGGEVRDFWGNPQNEIDEDTLKAIAQTTGGRYFRATDADTLDNIYREINQLIPTERDTRYIFLAKPLYPYPAGLALCLSVLLVLSSFFRSKKSVAA